MTTRPSRPATLALVLLLYPSLYAQAGGGGAAGSAAGAGSAGPGVGVQTPATAGPTAAAGKTAPTQLPGGYVPAATPGLDPRTPAPSRPGALTLQQVLDRVRTGNTTLAAAAENLRAVRAQEIQAGVRANPTFTIAGQNVTLRAAGDANPYSYSGQVARLFELGDKRRWRLDQARANTAQTAAQLADTSRQTVLAARLAFLQMLIARQSLALAGASLADFRHEVDVSRERLDAGDLGKLDFERLDLQLGSFESDDASARIGLAQASDQLQTLMGASRLDPDFDIAGDVVPPAFSQTHDELVQAALAGRPDYAAARAGTSVAVAAAQLARANGFTDPTLEAEYDRSGRNDSAGFSINVPLRIFDRNQGNRATAEAQVAAARLTEEAARRQVISDVEQAWVGYVEARRLSDRFGQHYLDESRDVLDIAQYAFEHGGIALIDYLDALRAARSSTSDALAAYQRTWQAIAQLSAASSTDLTP